jgi:hypothetical protein
VHACAACDGAAAHARPGTCWRARLRRCPPCIISLKCVQAMTLGGSGRRSARCCSAAHSRPTPSEASVPLPNSSMMHRDLSHRTQAAGPAGGAAETATHKLL